MGGLVAMALAVVQSAVQDKISFGPSRFLLVSAMAQCFYWAIGRVVGRASERPSPVSDADSDLASEHGEVDEELCPSGAIPFALLPYICGASYAMNYSAPSILPYVVSAYAEAEREQSLLWMLVLQSTGDVAGRVL